MKPIKKDISSLGNINDNNHLTERVVVNEKKMFIKDIIREIGVIERSISYKINKSGTKITYYLKLPDGESIEVSYIIWTQFESLPVSLKQREEKKYFTSKQC